MGATLEIREKQFRILDILYELDDICEKNKLKYYLAYGTVLGAVRHKGFIPWDADIDIMVDIDTYDRFCEVINRNSSNKYFLFSYKTDATYDSLKARIGEKGVSHHDIHIDIFPMVGAPNSEKGRKVYSKVAWYIYRAYFVKKVNVKSNYNSNSRKKFMAYVGKGLLLFIPSKFLIKLYKVLSKAYPLNRSYMVYNFCGSYGYKELIPKHYLESPVYLEFEGGKFPVPKKWDEYLKHLYGDYMNPRPNFKSEIKRGFNKFLQKR